MDEPDTISWVQALAEVGESTARRLARHTAHVGLDGMPAWDRERWRDLLEMDRQGLLG
jgi:hypothetical protein